MNERIKELIEKCTSWSDGSTWIMREEFDKEKFTELIVKESLAVIQNQLQGDNDISSVWVTINIIDPVKNHFGIE